MLNRILLTALICVGGLLFFCIQTAYAFSIPKLDGRIHNLTSYPSSSFSIGVKWECERGSLRTIHCGKNESRVSVNEDGTFSVPGATIIKWSSLSGTYWVSVGVYLGKEIIEEFTVNYYGRDFNRAEFQSKFSIISVIEAPSFELNLVEEGGSSEKLAALLQSGGLDLRVRTRVSLKKGGQLYPAYDSAEHDTNLSTTLQVDSFVTAQLGERSLEVPLNIWVSVLSPKQGIDFKKSMPVYLGEAFPSQIQVPLDISKVGFYLNGEYPSGSLTIWKPGSKGSKKVLEIRAELQCLNQVLYGQVFNDVTDALLFDVNGDCHKGEARFDFSFQLYDGEHGGTAYFWDTRGVANARIKDGDGNVLGSIRLEK